MYALFKLPWKLWFFSGSELLRCTVFMVVGMKNMNASFSLSKNCHKP